MVVDYRFKLRRGTAAEWAAADPILLDGEPGVETNNNKFKIGDGIKRWSQLPYYLSEDAISDYIDEQLANAAPVTPEEIVRIADLVRVDLEIPAVPDPGDLVLYYLNTKA